MLKYIASVEVQSLKSKETFDKMHKIYKNINILKQVKSPL